MRLCRYSCSNRHDFIHKCFVMTIKKNTTRIKRPAKTIFIVYGCARDSWSNSYQQRPVHTIPTQTHARALQTTERNVKSQTTHQTGMNVLHVRLCTVGRKCACAWFYYFYVRSCLCCVVQRQRAASTLLVPILWPLLSDVVHNFFAAVLCSARATSSVICLQNFNYYLFLFSLSLVLSLPLCFVAIVRLCHSEWRKTVCNKL